MHSPPRWERKEKQNNQTLHEVNFVVGVCAETQVKVSMTWRENMNDRSCGTQRMNLRNVLYKHLRSVSITFISVQPWRPGQNKLGADYLVVDDCAETQAKASMTWRENMNDRSCGTQRMNLRNVLYKHLRSVSITFISVQPWRPGRNKLGALSNSEIQRS